MIVNEYIIFKEFSDNTHVFEYRIYPATVSAIKCRWGTALMRFFQDKRLPGLR